MLTVSPRLGFLLPVFSSLGVLRKILIRILNSDSESEGGHPWQATILAHAVSRLTLRSVYLMRVLFFFETGIHERKSFLSSPS